MEQSGQPFETSNIDSSSLVVAIFYEDDRVEAAVLKLEELGFKSDEIDVSTKELLKPVCDDSASENSVIGGATTGVVSGGVVGGVFGLLMAVGTVLPEFGAVVASGVFGVTLAGIGVGAASGGVLGSLIGLRMSSEPDEEHQELFKGGVLVAVEAGSRDHEAISVLIESGGDLGPTNAAAALASTAERRAYFS